MSVMRVGGARRPGEAERRSTIGVRAVAVVALGLWPGFVPAQTGSSRGPDPGMHGDRDAWMRGAMDPWTRGSPRPTPSPAPQAPPARAPDMAGPPMAPPASAPRFYQEPTFLVVIGLGLAGGGFGVYWLERARRRRRALPTGFVSQAVFVVDLVESTNLATHYGDGLAMRARNAFKDRTLAVAEKHGLDFAENTGGGCLMTFPTVAGAVETAMALLRDLRDRPPDLSPGPPLAVRIGISYGEILLDARGGRHGAAMNKAFRLEGLSRASFAQLEGESEPTEIPDHDRIFLDEEAAKELNDLEVPHRFVGFCSLEGFSGLHRVYEVPWQTGPQ